MKITPQGRVKILDFGLARALAGEAAADPSHSPKITEAMTYPGTIMGTAAYMSPEQARGKVADKRADIWAFGCVLYECLTGNHAFLGETIMETVAKIPETTPDWSALPPNTPGTIRSLLQRCLQKDRSARYPSATELRKDLVAYQSRVAASQVGLRSALHRPRIMIAALALLALLLVGIGWIGISAFQSRWVHTVALPEITRLMDKEDYVAAFRLARKVDRYDPNEAVLQRLRREM